MTTCLTACLTVPQVYVQLAHRQIHVRLGVPLVITSGTTDRAVVIDACPRAVQRGIRIGMAPREARTRCPDAHIVPVQQLVAEPFTAEVEHVLFHYSDLVEHIAVGTWQVELVALGPHFRHARRHLHSLQDAVMQQTGCPCQLGLAANGMVATIAAQRATTTPLVVYPNQEARFLAPLPVQLLPGVGSETAKTLAGLGITRIGQLARLSEGAVVGALGPRGRTLRLQALGQAVPNERVRAAALSERTTFAGEPCTDARTLQVAVRLLTERVGRTLRTQHAAAGTITVVLTGLDGRQAQHSHHFMPRCDLDPALGTGSHLALDHLLRVRRVAVTNIEVRVTDLGAIQHDLLTADDPKPRHIQQAVDAVKEKHGTGALVVAWLLSSRRAV